MKRLLSHRKLHFLGHQSLPLLSHRRPWKFLSDDPRFNSNPKHLSNFISTVWRSHFQLHLPTGKTTWVCVFWGKVCPYTGDQSFLLYRKMPGLAWNPKSNLAVSPTPRQRQQGSGIRWPAPDFLDTHPSWGALPGALALTIQTLSHMVHMIIQSSQ